jgi:predicted amidophosphoribosyltransferase
MTTPAYRVQVIRGNWAFGWALDIHSESSTLLSDGRFDTKRTPVGELLFHLKYRAQVANVEPLAAACVEFLRTRYVLRYLSAIVPVPPSDLERPLQPVFQIADRIGRELKLPVLYDQVVKTRATEPLKNVDDPGERRRQLLGAFRVRDRSLENTGVLVFDDLYRSGETLREVCDVLVGEGGVLRNRLYVLTLTKTRSIR